MSEDVDKLGFALPRLTLKMVNVNPKVLHGYEFVSCYFKETDVISNIS